MNREKNVKGANSVKARMIAMRLIDANDFRYKLQCEHIPSDSLSASTVNNMIADAPTVDAVSVVKCGECRMIMPATEKRPDYCPIMQNYPAKDFYCGAGERKDGEK